MLGRLLRKRKTGDPYLLTGRFGFVRRAELELLVSKERLRVDRGSQPFSFVVLRLLPNKLDLASSVQIMAHLLAERLRLTDERAIWSIDQIALLLPQTDRIGTQCLLDNLTRVAADRDIYFEVESFQYPENSNYETEDTSKSEQAAEPQADYETAAENIANQRSITAFLSSYPAWKRQIDVIGAISGLVLSAPIIGLAAVAIKLNSPGPVLFKQKRTGYHGRVFEIYKLRSMITSADEQKSALLELNERDGPAFKMANDPRVTTVGKFLRATGLDEFPQLWNVLRGDMAIVGPRPLPCDEDAQCLQWQRRRLETKPGLTCYWQTSKSRRVSFSDWMRMDLRYHNRRSLSQDSYILLRTVLAVMLGRVGH